MIKVDKRILFTYLDIQELRKYESQLAAEGKIIYSFIVAENYKLLDDAEDIAIDITTVVQFLNTESGNRLSAEMELDKLDAECVIIIQEKYADVALEMFPYIFEDIQPLFEKEVETIKLPESKRMSLYSYANNKQLAQIIKYASEHEVPISSFPSASGDLRSCFDEFNKSKKLALVDLTSLSHAIEDNKNIIYHSEQFFGLFTNVKYILNSKRVDTLLDYFALCFDRCEPINHLIKEIEFEDEMETDDTKRCITDLSPAEFQTFCDYFNKNLIGHKAFKVRFFQALKNFRTLNRVNDQKVFSVFLFGASGIGKTEVARLVAEQLHKKSYFPKINFANYSDQNALNILIGSPPGYVGCEHGELSDKVEKSKVGLILCDEFEKTNRPIFSFFLEMLEDGKFTDTMAKEFDVNGFIIVFTSNILDEKKYKEVIPPELQTRLDLVCEFKEPSTNDKLDFLNLLFDKATEKYVKEFAEYAITVQDKKYLYAFDYQSLHALRDIKREFQNRLIQLFEERRNKDYLQIVKKRKINTC